MVLTIKHVFRFQQDKLLPNKKTAVNRNKKPSISERFLFLFFKAY